MFTFFLGVGVYRLARRRRWCAARWSSRTSAGCPASAPTRPGRSPRAACGSRIAVPRTGSTTPGCCCCGDGVAPRDRRSAWTPPSSTRLHGAARRRRSATLPVHRGPQARDRDRPRRRRRSWRPSRGRPRSCWACAISARPSATDWLAQIGESAGSGPQGHRRARGARWTARPGPAASRTAISVSPDCSRSRIRSRRRAPRRCSLPAGRHPRHHGHRRPPVDGARGRPRDRSRRRHAGVVDGDRHGGVDWRRATPRTCARSTSSPARCRRRSSRWCARCRRAARSWRSPATA